MEKRSTELRDQRLGRRGFIGRLAAGAAASALLPMIGGAALAAPSVLSPLTSPNDPRITVKMTAIPGAEAKLSAYVVTPVHPELTSTGKPLGARIPAIVLIGEDRGLNDHIKDLARRYGVEGFYCVAIDYLAPMGGTPADGQVAFDMAAKQKAEDVVAYARQAIAYAKTLPNVGKVGVVGYGKGGIRANELAEVEPGVGAVAAYYAGTPNLDKVSQIRAPLQLHYAAQDERHLLEYPKFEAALKKAGKTYQLYIYSYSKAGFTNDTDLAVYDQVNTDLAWGRTVAFFRKYLG